MIKKKQQFYIKAKNGRYIKAEDGTSAVPPGMPKPVSIPDLQQNPAWNPGQSNYNPATDPNNPNNPGFANTVTGSDLYSTPEDKPKGKQFIGAGDKTWNPFAKNNAWNSTTKGTATTDVIAGGLAFAAGVLPFQPVKNNRQPLPMTIGDYGHGSRASFKKGGKIKAKDGKTDSPIYTSNPNDPRLRAYNDSLQAFNKGEEGYKYYQDFIKKYNVPDNRVASSSSLQHMNEGVSLWEGFNNEKPVSRNYITYPFRGSDDALHLPPIDKENPDAHYDTPRFKKPVQPIVYKKSQPINNLEKLTSKNQPLPTYSNIDQSQPIDIQRPQLQQDNNFISASQWENSNDKSPDWYSDKMADGGPMISKVKPSAYTFNGKPMTRQQSMAKELPNYMAGSGIEMYNPDDPQMIFPISGKIGGSKYRHTYTMKDGGEVRGTKLTPEEQVEYNKWRGGLPKPLQWEGDYDLRGFWKENPNYTPKQVSEHMSDKFKLPNHPTFSGYDNNIYYNDKTKDSAGTWQNVGEDQMYIPNNPKIKDTIVQKPGKPPMKMKNGELYYTEMAMGGQVPFDADLHEGDVQVDNNQFKMLSGKTAELTGNYHSNGGTDIQSNGQQVEAERAETIHIAPDGSTIVGGNLYVPNTNTKFKDAFKEVAKGEKKTDKMKTQATKFLNEFGKEGMGAKNQYSAPAFNYGKVMADAYEQTNRKNEENKQMLTETQNKMLELGGMIDPKEGAKKVSQMFKGSAKWGKKAANGIKITDDSESQESKDSITNQGIEIDPNKTAQEPKPFDPAQSGVVPDNIPAGMFNTDGTPLNKQLLTGAVGKGSPVVDSNNSQQSISKGLRNKFRASNYLGEINSFFDQVQPVQGMQEQSILEPEYNVSFQNEKNSIQSAYGPALKSATSSAQKAAISAQMAEQLANVDAKEFQYNQQNTGAIKGRNYQELRGVRDTNLKLAMDQIAKTDAAQENTREGKQRAATSISGKEAQRRAANNQLALEEQYKGWAYNPENQQAWQMLHPGEIFNPRTVTIEDMEEVEKTKEKKTDSKGRQSIKETDKEPGKYGKQIKSTYFTDYNPSHTRNYFGGGMIGGMPGAVASRMAPGGKKKKKVKS